jgi:dihydrofolate synthase/folylpolyglutamate synthase
MKAPLFRVGGQIRLSGVSPLRGRGTIFEARTWRRDYGPLFTPMMGRHQAENAAVAVGMVECLNDRFDGIVPPRAVVDGLKNTRIPGRLQVVSQKPLLVVDGAHNPVSMRALRAAVDDNFDFRRMILVFGSASDKDVRGTLAGILPITDYAVMTRAGNPRACRPDELCRIAAGLAKKLPTVACGDSATALDAAFAMAEKDDLILVTGSFYLAGETLELRGVSAT